MSDAPAAGGALLGAWFTVVATASDAFGPQPMYSDPWGRAYADPWSDPVSAVNTEGVVTLLFAVGCVVAAPLQGARLGDEELASDEAPAAF